VEAGSGGVECRLPGAGWPCAVAAPLTGGMMNAKDLAAYLDRIGAIYPSGLGQAELRGLHRAHLLTVPFENLSIHLSERISLDEGDLIDKIVTRRRGGFCYELNGAFALLLEALGGRVTRGPAGCGALMVSGRRSITWPYWSAWSMAAAPGSRMWASVTTASIRCF
jgi:N-acetyltransferase